MYYDKTNNFGNPARIDNQPEEVDNQLIRTPAKDLYKDINISSPVPHLTNEHMIEYMKSFDKNVGVAEEMYASGYLCFLRYCVQGIR